MNTSDAKAFDEIWSDAMRVYGRQIETRTTMMVFNALIRFSLEEVKTALSRHMTNPDTGQYPPKPADIVRLIRGSSQTGSGEAWAKVDYAIRCVGHYRSVVFDDPKIHAAIIRLGGWIRVAQTPGKEFPFLRNEFLTLYQGFTIQPPKDFPNKLIGACEHDNSLHDGFKRGKNKDQPALIGDAEKARLVYEQGGAQGVTEVNHVGTQAYLERLTDDIGKPALEHKP